MKMKVKIWRSLSLVSRVTACAALLSVIHCDVSKRTTDSSSPALERSQLGDFVLLDLDSDSVTVESSAQVKYRCTRACRAGLEVVFSTPNTTGLVPFRRTWTHLRQFGKTKTRRIRLSFPPAVIYRRDFFMRWPVEARDVMVRAWLVHLDGSSHVGEDQYHQSLVRTFKFLQTVPLSGRPTQPQALSVAWGAGLMWNLTKDRLERCSPESDVVDLLAFPFASTGEKYGVIRTFSTFINGELEAARRHATEKPRLTLSVWLYLLDWCSQKYCGILRHINENKKYGSPLIMLSKAGEVVVQVYLVSREESAFTAHTSLPLRTWIRLDLFIQDSRAKLRITHADPTGGVAEATHLYKFQDSVSHNDTSGFFVIGGDIYMPGIRGYFGPIKYHRLGVEEVVSPLSPLRTLNLLDEAHTECEEIRQVTEGYIHALQDSHARSSDDVCESYYERLRRTFGWPRCTQTWSWDQRVKYSTVLKLLKMQEEQLILSGPRSSRSVALLSQQLFQDAVRKLGEVGAAGVGGPETVSSVTELLQGHAYSLMGALGDERLSLLHLGYKHMQGLDGFPKDHDMAYGYYANVGRQTSIDRDKVKDSEQSITEHVHLTSVEEVQMHTGEEGDIVPFLRLQAERGNIESQKSLARMLFWGSNGVKKDVSEAVKWFAKSGLQMTDATAMYDYGILLLKGTGVKRNRTLGLKFLKKAADMGSVAALNGLGWYYSTLEKDDRKAVHYFDLAARNGSRDGVFNLGVYHLKGAHPDRPGKNETAAFQCFLKAGQLGHVEAAVEAALSLSRGTLAGVRRDPEKAVILLKQISEKNGYLGFTVREALKTYQRGSWDEALVKYAMLAETGLVVAQNNAAHLCEVLKHDSSCQWRYHNYSTYNHAPHESGLLTMGDHYSAVGDMVKAIALYSRAALQGSPQGIYNLAALTAEGYSISRNVLEQMWIPAELDKSTVVERLLLRCREVEGAKDDLSPCSLALFGMQVGKAWRNLTRSSTQLTVVWGSLTVLLLFVLAIGTQSALSHYSAAHANQSSVRQRDPVNQASMETTLDAAAVHQSGRPGAIQIGRPLREAADLVITATGVCVCALCVMLLTHLF
ncbi:protein sel-1 homolog 3 isoform X2 [Salminus brasiliensis]|uniref:protein sel-1 homolog 3 isoform X2 n=1 Tax=Salminus brasiliensis TaxID=930266 RepID=UPI003B837E1D